MTGVWGNIAKDHLEKRPMTLQEAQMILGVTKDTPPEKVEEIFNKLFTANDPEKGGSFYLQSKIYYAKQFLDRHRE